MYHFPLDLDLNCFMIEKCISINKYSQTLNTILKQALSLGIVLTKVLRAFFFIHTCEFQ